MENRIQTTDQLPQTCIDAMKSLPEDILKSSIMDEILLEIYNGWPGEVGRERVIECISFITERIPQYAKMMDRTPLDVLTIYAKSRRVSYSNWFQNSYLPDLSNVIIFDTINDFKKQYPSGKYICPNCDGISTDYQECNSGKKTSKRSQICDWKVYGLFGDLGKGIRIIIKDKFDEFPKPIPMFKPIELSQPIKQKQS